MTLNLTTPSTKFTMEYSMDQIPYLDVLIKRNENGIIWVDVYDKPIYTQKYLPLHTQDIVNETSYHV